MLVCLAKHISWTKNQPENDYLKEYMLQNTNTPAVKFGKEKKIDKDRYLFNFTMRRHYLIELAHQHFFLHLKIVDAKLAWSPFNRIMKQKLNETVPLLNKDMAKNNTFLSLLAKIR